ncbi:MAG: cold shock domain-containing protein [bacterium]|nr:cold shock domain-containing protein [bacterium]
MLLFSAGAVFAEDVINGKVKFYNAAKGYGFIIPDNGGQEVFVNYLQLNGLVLSDGQAVTFETQQGRRGPEAINIKIR